MIEFQKYGKIRGVGYEENEDIFTTPDDIIYVEEKIDGANFRFMVKDSKLIFGSRGRQLTSDEGKGVAVSKNFKRCAEFVREAFNKNQDDFKEGLIYYGECCIRHTIDYDWEKIPPFLGFDIFSIKEAKFLEDKRKQFVRMNLPVVPSIKICKAEEVGELVEKDVPKSVYASMSSKDLQAEGMVFKNYTKQIFAKFVREKFKEANKDAFGMSKKHIIDDALRVVAMYCTNARIDKQLFKLIDDGEKLEMPLMHKLPKEVIKDIMEEHGIDIAFTKWTIDFDRFKKKVSRRCLEVLKQVVINNKLNEESK